MGKGAAEGSSAADPRRGAPENGSDYVKIDTRSSCAREDRRTLGPEDGVPQ